MSKSKTLRAMLSTAIAGMLFVPVAGLIADPASADPADPPAAAVNYHGPGSVNIQVLPTVVDDASGSATVGYRLSYTSLVSSNRYESVNGVEISIPDAAANVTFTLAGTAGQVTDDNPQGVPVSENRPLAVGTNAQNTAPIPTDEELAAIPSGTPILAITHLGPSESSPGYQAFAAAPLMKSTDQGQVSVPAPVAIDIRFTVPQTDADTYWPIRAAWVWRCWQQTATVGSYEEGCQRLDYYHDDPDHPDYALPLPEAIQAADLDASQGLLTATRCRPTADGANWYDFGADVPPSEFNYASTFNLVDNYDLTYSGATDDEDSCDQVAAIVHAKSAPAEPTEEPTSPAGQPSETAEPTTQAPVTNAQTTNAPASPSTAVSARPELAATGVAGPELLAFAIAAIGGGGLLLAGLRRKRG